MMSDIPQAPVQAKNANRRGVVLVAVLVVIVLLSLAGYHYADAMLAEYRACENAHRSVQAQKFADSGIHYAAALLSSPQNFDGLLNGNPWNNPQKFQGIPIQGDGNLIGYFDIIAPPPLDDSSASTTWIYGVQDEGSKINPNAVMKIDATGKALYTMLMTLPNMTDTIAANIVAWMGGAYGISQGGAGESVYMGLPQPYHCKSAPIDSIDELILVQGVTWDLLYGSDLNRNGVQEDNELGPAGYSRGWSAFLTVHSREANYDATGNSYVYLNNTDLKQLYGFLLEAEVNENLAKFIIMYCENGAASPAASSNQNVGSIVKNALTGALKAGNVGDYVLLFDKSAKTQIKSIFELCNVQVSITTTDPDTMKQVTTIYPSPVSDIASQRSMLPALFKVATLVQATEIPARINVNTAPSAVLAALPGLQTTDVQSIMAARPDIGQGATFSELFETPVWLLTEAQISLATLKKLDQYVTTRAQVYRVQSVGYFEGGKGPAIRLEAVIDTNAGRPRILAWRSLSELGKGWSPGTTTAPPSATPSP